MSEQPPEESQGPAEPTEPSEDGPTQQETPLFLRLRAEQSALTEEDKNNAFYAHAFPAVANLLFCGAAVPICAPLLVLLMDKRRSGFVMFHINQSFLFQTALFAINLALGIVFAIISLLTCGLGAFLFALNAVPPVVGVGYALYIGLKAREGLWAEYPIVGPRVLRAHQPLFR